MNVVPRVLSQGTPQQKEHGLAMLREAARTARAAVGAQPKFGSAKGRICRLELPWKGGRITLGAANGVLPGMILYARHQNRFVVKINKASSEGFASPILHAEIPLPLGAGDLPLPTPTDFADGIEAMLSLLETPPSASAEEDVRRCVALIGNVILEERPDLSEHMHVQVPVLHRLAVVTATPTEALTWQEKAPARWRRLSPELAAAMRSLTGDIVPIQWAGAIPVMANPSHDIRIGCISASQLLDPSPDPLSLMSEIRSIASIGRKEAAVANLSGGPHLLEPIAAKRRRA